jgi:ribosomal protein L11 methyltransferase
MPSYSLFISVPRGELDSLTNTISPLEGFLGLQETESSDSDLFAVPEGMEFQEFGTKAAERFDEHLKKNTRSTHFIKIYFEIEESEKIKIEKQLKNYAPFKWDLIESKDYVDEYKKHVKGNYIGKKLWVGPPWDLPSNKDLIKYIIEPGLGFGTGEHPTTQMCLATLEELKDEINPKNILDLGCGSGILSMACLDFFPKASIWATDLDPLCENEVSKNFALNSKDQSKIKTHFGKAASLSSLRREGAPLFDLLVSDIYVNVLIDLLAEINSSLSSGAFWLLSGILEDGSQNQLVELTQKEMRLVKQRRCAHPQNSSEIWLSMLWQKS